MAQKLTPQLTDAVDGSPADSTVSFSLDGVNYEINLAKSNRNALIGDLARFMTTARKTNATGARKSRTTSADPRAVREWARANGVPVHEGGRLPHRVIEQFHAAGN